MKKFISVLRGSLVTFLIALATLIGASTVIIFGLFIKLLPIRSWRKKATTRLLRLPMLWISTLQMIMKINSRGKWRVSGPQNLVPNGCYILISNHVSWVDILILNACFNRKIPVIKFFTKNELKWQLPLAGLACWLLDYPFMQRHSKAAIIKNPTLRNQDIETIKKACQKLRQHPVTLVNFIEGTRFTAAKKARQNSPFENLLKPRSAGTAVAIEQLYTNLTGIIDATLCFPDDNMTFWKFACGDFSHLILHYRVIQPTQDLVGDYHHDRQFRVHFQTWLNALWHEKDALINQLKKQ